MSTRGNPVIATICHHLLHVGKLPHILEWLIRVPVYQQYQSSLYRQIQHAQTHWADSNHWLYIFILV